MVALSYVLAVIPENDFVWSILNFDGTGLAPGGISMVDFEDRIKSLPNGLLISWHELKAFADGLHQAIHCLIVGVVRGNEGSVSRNVDEISACEVMVEVLDSTRRYVWARDSAVMERLSSI